tara:strand:- start:166 stop:339 length:174 start_codon:yes stop_codon:yes gene_type:complete
VVEEEEETSILVEVVDLEAVLMETLLVHLLMEQQILVEVLEVKETRLVKQQVLEEKV